MGSAIAGLCCLSLLACGSASRPSAPEPASETAGSGVGRPACGRYASVRGSDSGSGSRARPFRSIARLARSLSPGETGCLLTGVFREDVTIRRGGRPSKHLWLRSAPRHRATIRGRLWIADSADYVTISDLVLDGRNDDGLPSPTVNGDYVRFVRNDVTKRRSGDARDDPDGICFSIGSASYGLARKTLIAGNRIHACGSSNNRHHGIYAAYSRGLVIRNNFIYDNGDRGVQLYPDADRTLIERNVIDGNGTGVIFSGDGTDASTQNIVRWNTISNSRIRWNVEGYYPDESRPDLQNRVFGNCVWPGNRNVHYQRRGGIQWPHVGFVAYNNRVADPGYVDREAKDFRLRPSSPCRGLGPRGLSAFAAGS